jgi:aminoglycoside 3'-phosphotransferase-2
VNANLVDEADFDDARAGRSATEVFAELLATTAPDEDLVFTHCDFSLPNIILQQTANGEVEVAGLIDCGRAGMADRYQDLALIVRDVAGTFGDACVAPFLLAYGAPELRRDRLAYYTLLDEFF